MVDFDPVLYHKIIGVHDSWGDAYEDVLALDVMVFKHEPDRVWISLPNEGFLNRRETIDLIEALKEAVEFVDD